MARELPACAGAERSPRAIAALAVALAVWTGVYLSVERASRFLAFRVLGLVPATHLGSAVAFFLYEAPKVLRSSRSSSCRPQEV